MVFYNIVVVTVHSVCVLFKQEQLAGQQTLWVSVVAKKKKNIYIIKSCVLCVGGFSITPIL